MSHRTERAPHRVAPVEVDDPFAGATAPAEEEG